MEACSTQFDHMVLDPGAMVQDPAEASIWDSWTAILHVTLLGTGVFKLNFEEL